MSFNYEVIHGLDFTKEEIEEALCRKGLLSLELEFSKRCNLRCVYCYSNAGEELKDEMTKEEILDVIDQADSLGAKKIILLGGGEPFMFEGITDVVKHINQKGLEQTIFTNGAYITRDMARFLFQHNVSVIVKHNSFNQRVQDSLAGVEGSYNSIQAAIANLTDTGYPKDTRQLGIQTVIVKQNIKEIPSMWKWARKRGIIPYFEALTLQGRAKKHEEIELEPEEVQRVFDILREIDRKQFGHQWRVHPTIASFTCKRHLYSCLINSQGYVQPCTGVDLHVGNIRQQSLSEIIQKSHIIKDLRKIHTKIEEPCRSCELSSDCYGCRGNAYQMTGNYLASDPGCWLGNEKNRGKVLKITCG